MGRTKDFMIELSGRHPYISLVTAVEAGAKPRDIGFIADAITEEIQEFIGDTFLRILETTTNLPPRQTDSEWRPATQVTYFLATMEYGAALRAQTEDLLSAVKRQSQRYLPEWYNHSGFMLDISQQNH